MPPTPVLRSTAWGVRAALSAFILACQVYNKHKDRCRQYLTPTVCNTLEAVCTIVLDLETAYVGLPPVGS